MSKINSVKPRCYKLPLIAGLRQMHQLVLADQVEAGELKLGIAAQMRSVDRIRPDLAGTCANALEQSDAQTLAENNVLSHYAIGLREGRVVVAHPGGTTGGQSYYAPGELYFRS